MALKSVQEAIADLARLDAANTAYANLQRAMNAVGAAVNGMADVRRKAVFDEIETGVMEWLSSGMPPFDLPDAPAEEAKPAAPRKSSAARVPYGTGASVAVIRFLMTRPDGATPREIAAGVAGKFDTKTADWRLSVSSAVHNMAKGRYARLTRENNVYKLIPGRGYAN